MYSRKENRNRPIQRPVVGILLSSMPNGDGVSTGHDQHRPMTDGHAPTRSQSQRSFEQRTKTFEAHFAYTNFVCPRTPPPPPLRWVGHALSPGRLWSCGGGRGGTQGVFGVGYPCVAPLAKRRYFCPSATEIMTLNAMPSWRDRFRRAMQSRGADPLHLGRCRCFEGVSTEATHSETP